MVLCVGHSFITPVIGSRNHSRGMLFSYHDRDGYCLGCVCLCCSLFTPVMDLWKLLTPSVTPVHIPHTYPFLVTPVTKVLGAYHGLVMPVVDSPVSKFCFVLFCFFVLYICYMLYKCICLCVVYVNRYTHV